MFVLKLSGIQTVFSNKYEIYIFDSDLVWRMQLMIIIGLEFVLSV